MTTNVAHQSQFQAPKRSVAYLNGRINALNNDLSIAERERDITLEECSRRDAIIAEQRGKLSRVSVELDYARMEIQRSAGDVQDAQQLRAWKAMVLSLCAVPHGKLGPYEKLALITSTEQRPYSAAKHGGDPRIQLTSIGEWTLSIGNAVHQIDRVCQALAPGGTIKRTLVECGDGKRHYTVVVNEEHLRNPRLIRAEKEAERKHNGGNKRFCPQCGTECRKIVNISYLCTNCGVDFDRNMDVIHHPARPISEQETGPLPVQMRFSNPVTPLPALNPTRLRDYARKGGV